MDETARPVAQIEIKSGAESLKVVIDDEAGKEVTLGLSTEQVDLLINGLTQARAHMKPPVRSD